MKNRRQRWFRARIALLGVCVMCVAVLVVIRAFHVQIASGDRLRGMAEDQHLRHLRVSPRRGVIYDRDGAELAVSADVAQRLRQPSPPQGDGAGPTDVARRIAKILDVDPERLATRLRRTATSSGSSVESRPTKPLDSRLSTFPDSS